MKVRTVVLLVLSVLLFGSGPAAAQVSVTGSINGTVADTTDAVLPGAIVLLKDEGTGITKETTTNEAGAFAFRDLNFGTYQISVTMQGFRGAVYNKVVVESGRTTDLRVKLGPGGLEEAITVEGTHAGPGDDLQRDLEHAQQQDNHRAAAGRTQRVHIRTTRARRGRAAGHRQHAFQRHARRHHQPDDRRRQQLLERIQERRHELLRARC